MNMFCYQCQETARGKGCEIQGVCGKKAETSARMDLLLYALRGICLINRELREKGEPDREASHLVIDSLFTTITNANFDNPMLDDYIRRAFVCKNLLAGKAKKQGISLPDLPEVEFQATPEDAEKAEPFTGVLAEKNEDIHTGPTLPAFFTPDILKVLQEKFHVGTISNVPDDIKTMIG